MFLLFSFPIPQRLAVGIVFCFGIFGVETFLKQQRGSTEVQYLEVHLLFLLEDTSATTNHLLESSGVVHLLINHNQSTRLTIHTRRKQFAGGGNDGTRFVRVDEVIE